MNVPVVIVGAGLAGLVAATELRRREIDCVVVDKGRSVGGRMATRRAALANTTAVFDHGAQFFTVRSPAFAELANEWHATGIVQEWCRGFGEHADGFARYSVSGGMNALAKHLARDLNVVTAVTVHAITGNTSGPAELAVVASDERRWVSSSVVLTAPVPQSLALVDNGWLPIDDDVRAALDAVSYVPCLALLAVVDKPGAIREPGGLQLGLGDDPTWSFVGDNQRKGISSVPAITFHANDVVSRELFEQLDHEFVHQSLVAEAQRFLGSNAQIVASELKRWRYARPTELHPQRCVVTSPIEATTLVFGGDAFGEPRVEGAVLSGIAIADALSQR